MEKGHFYRHKMFTDMYVRVIDILDDNKIKVLCFHVVYRFSFWKSVLRFFDINVKPEVLVSSYFDVLSNYPDFWVEVIEIDKKGASYASYSHVSNI